MFQDYCVYKIHLRIFKRNAFSNFIQQLLIQSRASNCEYFEVSQANMGEGSTNNESGVGKIRLRAAGKGGVGGNECIGG